MDGNGSLDGGANLAHKFGGLALNGPTNSDGNDNGNSNNDSLFQVIKAVEAAEVTIREQAEENAILRTEHDRLCQELERYKAGNLTGQRPSPMDHLEDHFQGPHRVHPLDSAVVSEGDRVGGTMDTFLNDHYDASVQPHARPNTEDQSMQARSESHLDYRNIDGTVKVLSGGQRMVDSAGFSRFSSPSTAPFSPSTHQLNPPLNLSDNSSLWKQDLFVKIREHEEEILQLRRHLGDYTIKEAQIQNEKCILEKRIAHMRMAFDRQQQDLVDAASKAISYRQDIIEENIRLTYALQAAQEERSIFVSSVLPLLEEYRLEPPVTDTTSIIGNLKVLFKHLQEKLIITESKLKESQYQLTPWHTDVGTSNFPVQSPSHPSGLELTMTTADWDTRGHQNSGLGDGLAQTLEPDDMVRYSPIVSRNTAPQNVDARLSVSQSDLHSMHHSEETTAIQVNFRDPFVSTEVDALQVEGQQNESEPTNANWVSKNSHYSTSADDPASSYAPYLAPVLEEPSSSYSEAGEDDPLPGIDDLQITGDAFPGKKLQACGYSVNGTTSCNFEWVRHLEDGSINYIEGAKQPTYLVTADDIDTVLAIEVQPLDDRKRKGEIVTVFANEHRKITCDPEMQNSIVKTLHSGHASFRVSSWTRYLDIWEPAALAIKSDGYSIKGSGPNCVLVTEKFLPTTSVIISFGNETEFSIISSGGVERRLRVENNAEDDDVSCSRDAIVLTLRLFIMKAAERKKGKRRNLNLFFKH